ncbi:hypothetical protein GCM10029978_049090 [Actinoallomurus acanthiterrae]
MSSRRLAVTFLHGIEISDPAFAEKATDLLKRSFEDHAGVAADEALVIRPTFWAPALQEIEDTLYERCFGPRSRRLDEWLTQWVTRINAGSISGLWPFLATVPWRRLPWIPRPNYPVPRWLVIQFFGDAIAYQMTPTDRRVYEGIHAYVADTMGELAREAGEDAPLCVIAHSLGTVIASNYFYDLQTQYGDAPRPLIPPAVNARIGPTPLERGETLAFLYTLGSPLALWAMRYPDFGTPLTMPSPKLRDHHPTLTGEWINFQDPDDLVAYPLRALSREYEKQVTEDRTVSVGPWWLGWTPMAHWWYWNDETVIDPIARSLAAAWRQVNTAREVG